MKIKQMALSAALMAALVATVGAASAAGAPANDELARGDIAQQIVSKWSAYVTKNYPIGVDAWSVEMAPAFAEASMEELQAAAVATDFEDMNRHLLGAKPKDGLQALGDIDADLVFVPVTPCRLFDTRLAGGAIAADTVRNFDVSAAGSFSSQGGEANNCNVGNQGSFAAAVINLTVVTPSAPGYITAFPYLVTQPLAATLNYNTGDIVGNEVVVKLDQGASSAELSVYSFAQTHLVGDVVGYFAQPRATAFECEQLSQATSDIPGGGTATISSAACAATYSITGGSCTSTSFDGRVVTSRVQANGTHFCAFKNEGAGTMVGTAIAQCCRVPGR